MAGPEDPINALCDLNARNLYAGWYYGRAEQAGDDLDRHHAANPGVPLGLSEYGADARTEYHATDPEPEVRRIAASRMLPPDAARLLDDDDWSVRLAAVGNAPLDTLAQRLAREEDEEIRGAMAGRLGITDKH